MDKHNQLYWENYYKSQNPTPLPLPSQFACFCINEIKNQGINEIVDLAGGDGRDSLFFSMYNFKVTMVEKSKAAAITATENTKRYPVTVKLGDVVTDEIPISKARSVPIAFYSRFFIHTLPPEAVGEFFMNVVNVIRPEDRFYVEYRTDQDQQRPKVTKPHKRYFHRQSLIRNVAHEAGLIEDYHTSGTGYAKWQQDDAFIARHVFRGT